MCMVNRNGGHGYAALAALCAGLFPCIGLLPASAVAQAYPVRPVRMLVGFTSGSGADATARAVGQKLSDVFGQPFIIENRVGASGTLATERVSQSQADGYTLLVMTGADTAQPALRAKLPYDLQKDFAPVSMLATGPLLLVVHAALPAQNVAELIALANARAGKLNCGSAGVGTATHFAGALFNLKTRVKTTHVPFKGGVESAVATAAGDIDMSFPGIPAAVPLLERGKLRALAVTSAKRATLLPVVPTLDESGLRGYELVSWYGVSAPTGVSNEIITRLNAAIGKVVNVPAMKDWLIKQGFEPQTNTPAQFAAFIGREIAQGAELVKATGLKVE